MAKQAVLEEDLAAYSLRLAQAAQRASRQLAQLPTAVKNRWLRAAAAELRAHTSRILEANALDIAAAPGFGLTDAQIDRLRLDAGRVSDIAAGLEQVAALADPVGAVIESQVRPNGLRIEKVRVPLGVVLFIYESRPNVTADAAAICVKSGNAVILRGGKEAAHSSRVIIDLMNEVALTCGLPEGVVQLVSIADRAVVGHLLQLSDYIQLAIPRGGEGLIRRVAEEAKMPVIKHYTGNCHVYVDQGADLAMAAAILENSKCQRMGVCNAAESLLVHAAIAEQFLPQAAAVLSKHGVEIRGDEVVCRLVPQSRPATEADYAAEFLGPVISAHVVAGVDEAIEWINRYSSGHTETIVTDSLLAAEQFTRGVDSSAVMVNASTRFNDGGEFGLGAEIGISTDKFHARGPCGLNELTSYKYIVHGSGQIR